VPRGPSAIPVGTQFSPNLIDLPEFLNALVKKSGDRFALQQAIWKRPVHLKHSRIPESTRTANLPLEAAVQYGLLERRIYEVTPLAQQLARLPRSQVFEEFSRHILLQRGGLRVVEAAEQMAADGSKITADTLSQYLTDQGFSVTVHNTAINTMRMYLERVGVFSKRGWAVDLAAKERVLGLTEAALGVLVGLNEEQRAFIQALCRIDPKSWYPAADVRALAESTSGLRMRRASLPKEFLDPLKSAGMIEYRTRGTAGGKTSELRTTTDFQKNVLNQFVTKTIEDMDAPLAAYYKTRPEDIYAEMGSSDKYRKGRALEAYAIHVMRLMGLQFRGWRRRPNATGGAELDAVLSGAIGGVATRWQIQCKNTPGGAVDTDNVAREVGLATVSNATHVLIIANCRVTKDALEYASKVNAETPLSVYLLDRKDFESVKSSPGLLGIILRAKALETLALQAKGGIWASV
jgi:Restriction endonuclease